MTKAGVLITVLAASVMAAQAQSSASNPASSGAPQAGNPTSGRPPVQTKTREEYKAYQTAVANGQNPEAMEKAADDFAAKFPSSDVRVLLYRAAMSSYQNAGNPEKMMSMGLKVLAIDKDDPEALIAIAEILEERTGPTDLDRQQRSEQVVEYATHALKTLDTDLAVPAGTSPDRVEAYKKYLRSTALAIIGTIYYKQEHFAEAEAKLRNAMETDAANPDPVVVLRLALALDQQKKYPDALEQANRAVELTQEGTDLGRMARNERDRLVVQAGGIGASTVAPSGNQTAPQTASAPAH
jgi:tetratricopeptide (TPR) repeat protein